MDRGKIVITVVHVEAGDRAPHAMYLATVTHDGAKSQRLFVGVPEAAEWAADELTRLWCG